MGFVNKFKNNSLFMYFVQDFVYLYLMQRSIKQKTTTMNNLTNTQKIEIINNESNYWESVLNEATKEDVYLLANKMNLVTIHKTSGRKVNTKSLKGIIKFTKNSELVKFLRSK